MGLLAINKPQFISSAQVIRNLQHHFNPSSLFAPWLAAERSKREIEQINQRHRRKDKRIQVKIGHGGTLDPMATGVLIMGVGKGTKQLQAFLECTKTYEATVLFGAATDTYDVLGKVLRRAEYVHVTRQIVAKALDRFRGNIMQRPPIYSALRVQGKRLYEYAREGKEVPKEIEERPVEVKNLEIMEWLDAGSHGYTLPDEDAEEEAKNIAMKVLHLDEDVVNSAGASEGQAVNGPANTGIKRKRSIENNYISVSNKRPGTKDNVDPQWYMSGALQSPDRISPSPPSPIPAASSTSETHIPAQGTPPLSDRGPPAVRLRMTVTSGFYVRSLSHDLGEAVGSLACMSELVRTRQGEFQLGKNVLAYEELERGEDVWGPKIERILGEWRNQIGVLGANAGEKGTDGNEIDVVE